LPPEDFAKVMELLKLRPIQFCLFLKALVGVDELQRLMVQPMAVATTAGLRGGLRNRIAFSYGRCLPHLRRLYLLYYKWL
jgi:hypothetical protein